MEALFAAEYDGDIIIFYSSYLHAFQRSRRSRLIFRVNRYSSKHRIISTIKSKSHVQKIDPLTVEKHGAFKDPKVSNEVTQHLQRRSRLSLKPKSQRSNAAINAW